MRENNVKIEFDALSENESFVSISPFLKAFVTVYSVGKSDGFLLNKFFTIPPRCLKKSSMASVHL